MYALVKNQSSGQLNVISTELMYILNVRFNSYSPFSPKLDTDFVHRKEYGVQLGDRMVRHVVIAMSNDEETLQKMKTTAKVPVVKSNHPADGPFNVWQLNTKKDKKQRSKAANDAMNKQIEGVITKRDGSKKKKQKCADDSNPSFNINIEKENDITSTPAPSQLVESSPSGDKQVAGVSDSPTVRDKDSFIHDCAPSHNIPLSAPTSSGINDVLNVKKLNVPSDKWASENNISDFSIDSEPESGGQEQPMINNLRPAEYLNDVEASSENDNEMYRSPNRDDSKAVHTLSKDDDKLHPLEVSLSSLIKNKQDSRKRKHSLSEEENEKEEEENEEEEEENEEEEEYDGFREYLENKFVCLETKLDNMQNQMSTISDLLSELNAARRTQLPPVATAASSSADADPEGTSGHPGYVSFGRGIYLKEETVKKITERGDKLSLLQGKVNDLSAACLGDQLPNYCLAKVKGNKNKEIFPEIIIENMIDVINEGNLQYNYKKLLRQKDLSKLSKTEIEKMLSEVKEEASKRTIEVTEQQVRLKLTHTLFGCVLPKPTQPPQQADK
ncbi:hypothetical protein KUF71_001751 [Frankliniella fusca]|uniref:Uncharacterized protein n=1 Tax=Frankliniella fusca TaxID=407009 RepID=A0AAE1LM49_9NEOP|nr:hypothetical protein KUF71_001751 [Frankliniella fusca]